MPRFAASLMTLFTESPLAERFALARRAGFRGVECQLPYTLSADEIARRVNEARLEMVLLNTPAGDWDKGERGFAALPGREADFRQSLERGLAYARAARCSRLHVLAGIVPPGVARTEAEKTYIANLHFSATRAAADGVRILIEPLNATDAPGYFLHRMDHAATILKQVAHPNLWLQYDLYHAHMTGEPLGETFRAHFDRITHIQIAGAPGRHEPIPSDVPCADLFQMIDESGYDGWIGCEYRPRAGTVAGLDWLAPFGVAPEKG